VGHDTPDDPQHWTDGSLAQRVDLLRHQRAQAPDAARERLAAALSELPANERVELLATLAVGLSGDDEALLDQLLGDRSREVRQGAANLLLCLPGSGFVARAIARLAPLLRQERHLLVKRWVLEPPADVAPLDPPRPKHDPLGDRAWWLYQAARQVPLAWWTAHTGLQAAELITWAEGGDWTEALHRAWRDVLFTAPESDWCRAVVRSWPRGAGPDNRAAVLALLPLAEREDHWRQMLAKDGPSDALLAQLDPGCPAPQHLSLPLSQALATALLQRLAARPLAQDWPLRQALPNLAGLLHPAALPALNTLPRHADDPPSIADALHTVQCIAVARANFEPRTPS
jgi:hypothetical protein